MYDRLQKFREIVEHGSFTAAAASLRMSQPALTMAIQKLEHELGETLLERNETGLVMTRAGEIVYATACSHRQATQNLSVALSELRHERIVVRIGFIDSLAAVVADEGSTLEALEVSADVAMVVDNSRRLLEQLVHGEIDVAFVVKSDLDEPQVSVLDEAAERLQIVCAPSYLPETIEKSTIKNFISYDIGSRTSEYIEEYLQAKDLRMQAKFHSTSPDVMLRLALAGKGSVALPHSFVKHEIDRGTLQTITYKNEPLICERPIACIVKKGAVLPRSLESFAQEAMRFLRELN